MTPADRVRVLRSETSRADGAFVLYWMTAQRRTEWNFALERAAERARELGRPLLVLEALRCDYPHASARLHRFVLDGMADNRSACEAAGVSYYPYVEESPGAGKGLLWTLSERAAAVVADDHPGFFYPSMLAAAARQVRCPLEAVDGCGLLPVGASERAFPTAYAFRRHLQRVLPGHLRHFPMAAPLAELAGMERARIPPEVARRWPPAPAELLAGEEASLAALPIDLAVPPAATRGGARAAVATLERFVEERLPRYAEDRNHPDDDVASRLSPYLHFGHVSPHQAFAAVAADEGWSEDLLSGRSTGKRTGWWGMGPSAEAFLDQLVTWRELGFNGAARGGPGWDSFAALPAWARATLDAHRGDRRAYQYDLAGFEAAATHDPLWNAAQRELLREGRLHNYLRMLWGKKILEWTGSPEEALEVMFRLNDRYALDGRDPNSVSGITWCLGRYDRAWGPERPVYGKVRYMASRNTARKVRLTHYLQRYGPAPAEG